MKTETTNPQQKNWVEQRHVDTLENDLFIKTTKGKNRKNKQ